MFTVTCLHGARSGSLGQFLWPTWKDIVRGLPRKDILCKLPHSIALSNRHTGSMNTDIEHNDAFISH